MVLRGVGGEMALGGVNILEERGGGGAVGEFVCGVRRGWEWEVEMWWKAVMGSYGREVLARLGWTLAPSTEQRTLLPLPPFFKTRRDNM